LKCFSGSKHGGRIRPSVELLLGIERAGGRKAKAIS